MDCRAENHKATGGAQGSAAVSAHLIGIYWVSRPLIAEMIALKLHPN